MRLKEKEITETIQESKEIYDPLELDEIRFENQNSKFDAIIKFSIKGKRYFNCAVEIVPVATPKIIQNKCKLLQSQSFSNDYIPLVIAPFIGQKQAEILEKENISWLDLSGNMSVKALPNIYIEKKGNPNKYPDTAPIKNIFKGTSSLVSRALILKPKGFSSLGEIVDFINQKGGKITKGTVSKVLKSLEDNLLITKSKKGIKVNKPKELLDKLADSYSEYLSKETNKAIYSILSFDKLKYILNNSEIDYAANLFFASELKGLGVSNQRTFYVNSLSKLTQLLNQNLEIGSIDEQYGKFDFKENKEPFIWFNLKKQNGLNVVDDLELYLELINTSPRGPKIAESLKKRILEGFDKWNY